jgi:hypothetical protein
MSLNTTHYVTYYHANGSTKFPKGWYAFQASLGNDEHGAERIVVHKNFYNYSRKSRGEAVEKLFRARVGLTRHQEHIHTGLTCMDHKFDPTRLLAA